MDQAERSEIKQRIIALQTEQKNILKRMNEDRKRLLEVDRCIDELILEAETGEGSIWVA